MPNLELLASPEAWAALLTLIVMEVVLGIDNLLFISILTNRLPEAQQASARRVGIGAALFLRLALLGAVAWLTELTYPVIEGFGASLSWRDMILIAGGTFLIYKATREIHHYVDPEAEAGAGGAGASIGFAAAVGQILLLDVVFSIDSIITAVGMTPHFEIMAVAMVVAVTAMLLAAEPLADFIKGNPTILMLALGFLLLIGTVLVAEGFGVHVPKGYIYGAMAFSAAIEGANILRRRRRARMQGTAGEAAE